MTELKLLLINSPTQEYSGAKRPSYETTAPLGLGYLATIAKNAGVETQLIDCEAEKLSVNEIIKRASSICPTIVGINAFSTNNKLALKILRAIPASYKMVGGPYATLYEGASMPDITIVKGEAESEFINLLKRRPKGIINTGRVTNLDELPFIDRSFFVNDPYTVEGAKEASILTSRGCVYNCAYCSVPVLSGRNIRSRSIGNVIDEIRTLKRAGVDRIHIVDDLFNFSTQRVDDFCSELKKSGINIGWRALCRVEGLNQKLLKKMRDSGCYKLAFGIESASPRILKYIGKTQNLKKVEEVFNSCKSLGIKTKGFFTIGYPSETHEDIKRTLAFAKKLQPDEARFMIVRAFPGTRLYGDLTKKGFSESQLQSYKQFSGDGAYVKYHVMNITSLNGMSSEELNGYIKGAYKLMSRK